MAGLMPSQMFLSDEGLAAVTSVPAPGSGRVGHVPRTGEVTGDDGPMSYISHLRR